MGSIPDREAKIPYVSWPKKAKQNIKQKQYCNKFNQDFKNSPHQKKKNLKSKINKNRRNPIIEYKQKQNYMSNR